MNATPEMETVPAGRDVLHVEELAVKLGLTDETIRDAIRRGEIKASRVGRRLLIPVAEVRRILSPGHGLAVVV